MPRKDVEDAIARAKRSTTTSRNAMEVSTSQGEIAIATALLHLADMLNARGPIQVEGTLGERKVDIRATVVTPERLAAEQRMGRGR